MDAEQVVLKEGRLGTTFELYQQHEEVPGYLFINQMKTKFQEAIYIFMLKYLTNQNEVQ